MCQGSPKQSQQQQPQKWGPYLPQLAVCLAALALCAHAASDGPVDKAAALASCLPSSCASQRTVWDSMLKDRPSCIALHRVWWPQDLPRQKGKKVPQQGSLPVTLVTQLSTNRLKALEAQCTAWAGPLAAAVYLPLHNPGALGDTQLSSSSRQKLQAAVAGIEDLMRELRNAAAAIAAAAAKADSASEARVGPCELRVVLLYEVFAEERATVLYPVNALRNYARLLADTPLIANIDVDMLPSASLSRALAAPSGPGSGAEVLAAAGSTGTTSKVSTVYVIPAFETTCGGPSQADQVCVGGPT